MMVEVILRDGRYWNGPEQTREINTLLNGQYSRCEISIIESDSDELNYLSDINRSLEDEDDR